MVWSLLQPAPQVTISSTQLGRENMEVELLPSSQINIVEIGSALESNLYIAFTLKAEPAILLLVIYHPPKLWADFLDHFSELVSLTVTSYNRIIINGNFIIHVYKMNDPKPYSSFIF